MLAKLKLWQVGMVGGEECWRVLQMDRTYLMFSGFQDIRATYLTKKALCEFLWEF
jgi:hypothetical protein